MSPSNLPYYISVSTRVFFFVEQSDLFFLIFLVFTVHQSLLQFFAGIRNWILFSLKRLKLAQKSCLNYSYYKEMTESYSFPALQTSGWPSCFICLYLSLGLCFGFADVSWWRGLKKVAGQLRWRAGLVLFSFRIGCRCLFIFTREMGVCAFESCFSLMSDVWTHWKGLQSFLILLLIFWKKIKFGRCSTLT